MEGCSENLRLSTPVHSKNSVYLPNSTTLSAPVNTVGRDIVWLTWGNHKGVACNITPSHKKINCNSSYATRAPVINTHPFPRLEVYEMPTLFQSLINDVTFGIKYFG